MAQSSNETEDAINQLGPEDHAALFEAAEELISKEDYRQAMGHLMLAIKADPSVLRTKQRFVEFSNTWFLHTHNPFVEEAVIECLKTDDLNCASLCSLWYTVLLYHPSYMRFFGEKDRLEKHLLLSVKSLEPFMTQYFSLGLRKLIIYNRDFEKFLMTLRKMLLLDLESAQPLFPSKDRLAVAASISCYCSYVEYIFETDIEEEEKYKKLADKIENTTTPQADEVAILACYKPLHHLKSASRIASTFGEDPDLAKIIAEQIVLSIKLGEIAKSIPSITQIDDDVSQKVRGQYEEFPYPRWRYISPVVADPRIYEHMMGRPVKILVAGCGTGHEPAMFATLLPQAQILAVDLSRNSMAYAINRTTELGIKNIEFRHGDILKLGDLPDRYDIIYSGGVLHHMEDPVKGWKVLADLLKPDGFMQIGLYSKTARRFFLKAQDFVKEKGYTPDAEGMKSFRREAHNLLQKDVYEGVLRTADYFYLSMLRDLLFHVQEHDFDIPSIDKCIDAVGLEFMMFHLHDSATIKRYQKMFPRDPEGRRLLNWHTYELANPDTFKMMYLFWLCKKAA